MPSIAPLIFGASHAAATPQPSQAAQPLDADDIWLTSGLRYLGYADEVGVALSHVEKVREWLAKGLGKILRNPAKGEKWAYKIYNVPLIGKEKITPAIGYVTSYIYCGLNMISRAFQGWRKARDGGYGPVQSGIRTLGDLVGLGIFHYLATMLIAPKFLEEVGKGVQHLMLNKDGNEALKRMLKKQEHILYQPSMFEGSWLGSRLKPLGVNAARLSKAYPLLQLGLAVGLIPLISHPFDKAVQLLLDYTWRPLVGLNKIERTGKWHRYRSVPNPRYWNRHYHTGPIHHARKLSGTLHRRPDRFSMLFVQNAG